MKACAYARVSTLLGQDPSLQITNIREYCAARSLEISDEFIDKGISGTKESRPAFDEMIKQAKRGKFKVIVVAALDRLGRNTLHLLKTIQELDHYGVHIISLRENLDFKSPTGRMVLTVLISVISMEREIISTRIKEALAAKKIQAQKTGNGWRCGRKTIVTPERASRALLLRSQGHSIREIANQIGIAPSSVHKILTVRKP